MRIRLVIPAPPASYSGNQATADRWARILTGMGHQIEIAHPDQPWPDRPPDLLIALHARKSAAAIWAARRYDSPVPIVLALTGTDLYPDLDSSGVDPQVLQAADALVVLQPRGIDQLPVALQDRARVIYQSAADAEQYDDSTAVASTAGGPLAADPEHFGVAMLAHLRPVKDPAVVWQAVRLLPDPSNVLVRHAGAALDPDLTAAARDENVTNPRYAWAGELSHSAALRLLATSRLLVHPSTHEGGANVVSEALTAGIPVLATRIPGTEGILGADYPGYFPVGDAPALAGLLIRAENDPGYLSTLRSGCAARQHLITAGQEEGAWQQLLNDIHWTGQDNTS
jgi:putative glycosyltransferase (TIGR04348 family)